MVDKYQKANSLLLMLYEQAEALSLEQKTAIYEAYLRKIRRLAYAGHALAQFDLAGHYEDMGYWGVENPYYNPKKLLYWYTKACKNGEGTACNNLAHLYELGKICPRNLELALELYKRSSDLGCQLGQKNYRLMRKKLGKSGKYGNAGENSSETL